MKPSACDAETPSQASGVAYNELPESCSNKVIKHRQVNPSHRLKSLDWSPKHLPPRSTGPTPAEARGGGDDDGRIPTDTSHAAVTITHIIILGVPHAKC